MAAAITLNLTGPDKHKTTAEADFLIVACDPTSLPMDRTPEENRVFTALTNFTFHTFALRVKVPTGKVGQEDKPIFGVVLRPPMSDAEMDGRIYGFRNETAKQYTLEAANAMTHNYVVVYRLWNGTAPDQTAEQDEAHLKVDLGGLEWWPFGTDFDIVGSLKTPYFQHFGVKDVNEGLPWDYLALQGQNNTAYVHGSTCFESVLTIWQYIDLLFGSDDAPNGRIQLPNDRSARIVILGAGVSGLLMGLRLQELGYTNVTLIEKNDIPHDDDTLIYGKTHSLIFDDLKPEPRYPNAQEPTVCELGTCYLSPAYNDLLIYLDQRLAAAGQPKMAPPRGFQVSPGVAGNFRGIVVPGKDKPEPFDDFVYGPAKEALKGQKFPPGQKETQEKLRILSGATEYFSAQLALMGTQLPMPTSPLSDPQRGQTYQEFVNAYDLGVLEGILLYSYSIQGYGAMSSIPAFYGLVWISDTLILGEITNLIADEPLVTFFPEGWGAAWRRLSTGLKIRDGVTVTEIRRKGVTGTA